MEPLVLTVHSLADPAVAWFVDSVSSVAEALLSVASEHVVAVIVLAVAEPAVDAVAVAEPAVLAAIVLVGVAVIVLAVVEPVAVAVQSFAVLVEVAAAEN